VRGRDAEAAGDDAEGDAVEEVRGGERRCKSDSLVLPAFMVLLVTDNANRLNSR
jgi:hypothetical protein